jgi:hypothetical protein
MDKSKLSGSLISFRPDPDLRAQLEKIADEERRKLADVARLLVIKGLKAKGRARL